MQRLRFQYSSMNYTFNTCRYDTLISFYPLSNFDIAHMRKDASVWMYRKDPAQAFHAHLLLGRWVLLSPLKGPPLIISLKVKYIHTLLGSPASGCKHWSCVGREITSPLLFTLEGKYTHTLYTSLHYTQFQVQVIIQIIHFIHYALHINFKCR